MNEGEGPSKAPNGMGPTGVPALTRILGEMLQGSGCRGVDSKGLRGGD